METVIFKNSLETHNNVENLVIDLTTKIRAIPNVLNLKLDIELTCYICNVIENEVGANNKTNKKIDKLDVFVRIIAEVFNGTITEEDKKVLINQVEYLLNNNKIKLLDPFIIWGKQVYNYFKSKVV
jgi:hypothetical protein